MKKAKNRKDLTGQTFGKLKFIEVSRIEKPRYMVYWKALCLECGLETEISVDSLRAGTKTCFKCRKIGYKDPQEAMYKKLYRKAMYKNRQLKVETPIPYAEFKKLLKLNCGYCNSQPSNNYQYTANIKVTAKRAADSKLTYSGIDRIDNFKGYEPGNVISCCKRCNIAKGSSTHAEFMVYLAQIVKFLAPKL
jgi:acetone carboxylase gamma subunit